MRNDYIGTSIDGDARAACPCRSHQPCNTCQGRINANCGCARSACSNGCSKPLDRSCENDCGRQQRSCDSDCRQSRNACDNGCGYHDRTPAMVYAQHHDLDSIYCAEKALLRGTLFGCLDKPMCNERCTDNACTSQCQVDKFALWELRLYLNTHPNDQKALALLRKLTEQLDDDCGCAYHSDCNRWSWPDGPWPWEYQHCCGKEA